MKMKELNILHEFAPFAKKMKILRREFLKNFLYCNKHDLQNWNIC